MNRTTTIKLDSGPWSDRTKFYGAALAITFLYLVIGAVGNNSRLWALVNLPLSAFSILALGLAGAEFYLFVQRVQKHHLEQAAARLREIEQAQIRAAQRQDLLNQISRSLLDRLDCQHLTAEMLTKVAVLFDTDVVAVWVADVQATGALALKGAFGVEAATAKEFAQLGQAAWFTELLASGQQTIIAHAAQATPAELAAFCQEHGLASAAFNPIVCHGKARGVLAAFAHAPQPIDDGLRAEMQIVANLIAGVIQAEELYRDFIQIQKIDSLGTLASGIAHDLNNVLAAILACATYVKQQTPPANPAYRYLEATESSAHRGAALTKQLLAFARREGPRLVVFNPNECVEQTLKMLERSFDKSILVQRQLAKELRLVEADPSQIEQIILNIAINARDAMATGGIFTITTRNARLDCADPHRPEVKLPDGEFIVIGFRDTGPGMDAATQKRIFEPFFTTKRPGKGTGLGLSVVHNIVRNCGGTLRVQSAPGKGALFEVYLPVTTKPLPQPEPAQPAPTRGGHECILLAEDEDVIREMAQLSLEADGYKVIPAADGASALAIYRDHGRAIDLVIADMAMPHMSGAELLAAVRKLNPTVRVIVSSGYSHDLEGQRMLQHGCLGYLQKPYTAAALASHVRSVLDSGL